MKRIIAPVLFFLLLISGIAAEKALAGLSDYFVSSEWLAANQKAVTMVDVRVAPLYFLGHVDGALNIDKQEFLSTRGGVKSLIPTAREFETLMDRFGITPDTTVVAYAEDDNPYAARFVWTLRYHGHEKAYVLDGGYEKWAAEKRDVAYLPTKVVASSGYRCQASRDIRAEAGDLLTRLENPSVVIWDTRRAAEYQGHEVRADRGGHIPGAVHFHWEDLLTEGDGVKVLKSEDEIRTLLSSYGLTPDRQVVAHCQTGIRSSYATLVLLGLGYPQAQNYDGSWIEWANNRSFPIEEARIAAAK